MVMPCQQIERFIFGQVPMLRTDPKSKIINEQIQPASFDFRLGTIGYRMRSAALPNNETVAELVAKYKKYDFPLDTERSHYLERGMTYLIPLLESLALPSDTWAEFSTKSSVGRCDTFTRVMGDNVPSYNYLPRGYHGPVYLEVMPLSHDVLVKTGLSLVQGRFKTTDTRKVTGPRVARAAHAGGTTLFFRGEPLNVISSTSWRPSLLPH